VSEQIPKSQARHDPLARINDARCKRALAVSQTPHEAIARLCTASSLYSIHVVRFFTLRLLRAASQSVCVPLESASEFAGYAGRMRQAWIRVGDYDAFPASQWSNFSRLCRAWVPRH
jgi:hypothetical protein